MDLKDPYELIQYLNQIGLPFKERGSQIDLQSCPYCEQGKKGNYQHFSFHREKHVFNCMKCGVKGNLYRFKLDRGDIEPITRARNIEYKRPAENLVLTQNSSTFHGWYEKARGIQRQVLEQYAVGYEHKEIDGKKTLIIVYQYYDQQKALVNRKYRSADKKHMWTEKDAERTYYGLQFVDFEKEYLHVCEGEDDCHALVQMGLDNVVSVPYGAGNYSPAMDRVNQQFKKLILIFDNDDRGQQGARQFAEKAGLTKCLNVILPFKDARDCLLEGLDIFKIQQEINAAKLFRHADIVKVGDARDEFKKFVFKSEKLIGRMTESADFNRIVGGIRLSELTVITGHSGSGKTTFSNNLAAWCERIGYRPMVMAFENKFESIVRKFIEIYSRDQIFAYDETAGKVACVKDETWVDQWIDWLNEKHLYFLNKARYSQGGYYPLKKIGEVIEYAAKFYNVNFFVLDHLYYFLKLSTANNPVHMIDEAMRQIKNWTDIYNCHIVLICHPHKIEESRNGKAAVLGMNSSKGSSSIFQEADNYWVVSRAEKKKGDPEGNLRCKLTVLKNREVGNTGDIYFEVLANKNAMVPAGKVVPQEKADAEQQEMYWQK